MPVMNFVGNLELRGDLRSSAAGVATGRLALGDMQAFIQYSRQFTMPITQTASIANVLQSTVASAERVFELLDETEEAPDAAEPRQARAHARATSRFEDVLFRYNADTPLIEDMRSTCRPGQTVAIVGPTGAGKTTLVNLLMRFYDSTAGASPSTASTSRS